MTDKHREIPYNYTSFSDKEIVVRFMGAAAWETINKLRSARKTGRSAKYLFELLGDIWIVSRNPFIFDDLLQHPKRKASFIEQLNARLAHIIERADANPSVLSLHKQASEAVAKFSSSFTDFTKNQAKICSEFSSITHPDNLRFDGHSRVSHVTDATDWRVEYPFVVITPDHEHEMANIVLACIKLKLTIIPRGGGTGYTGSAVPLDAFSAVINTEKLDALSQVEMRELPVDDAALRSAQKAPTIRAGAGVVTQAVAKMAKQADLIFAVDPTSQDASTIGGNVAMNAGGKKAVIWGTTLDNLYSWKMVTPDGSWMRVTRLNHNLGKIHEQTNVCFKIEQWREKNPRALKKNKIKTDLKQRFLNIPGKSFRHAGLGKDVTDKFLSGLPGIQKEGCDGIITSARFILHQAQAHTHTVCLEFYEYDLRVSVPAIVQLRDALLANPLVDLMGLEHLDWRYIKAVKYSPKSAQGLLPRMVLIIDINSDDLTALDLAAKSMLEMAKTRHGQGFIATSDAARKQFWAARKRTAAIAAHTNAFKINEDVVIPLEKLGEYSLGIERMNIVQSIRNKIATVDAFSQFFGDKQTLLNLCVATAANGDANDSSDEFANIIEAKRQTALASLTKIRSEWQIFLNDLDAPLSQVLGDEAKNDSLKDEQTLMDALLKNTLRVSLNTSVVQPLAQLFSGRAMQQVLEKIAHIHKKLKHKRLFVALHMHAGDGNVHTNIPVNSSDYEMLEAAEHIVDDIMALARALDGVISGEHGIGLTKIKYMSQKALQPFLDYKAEIDPNQVFNKGKLFPGNDLSNAYTPSFSLLETEALILEDSDLGKLNESIKDCLRCGKCKPDCATHVPGANLLYSPRNKILATGLVIEAMLYEEQTRRGISMNHFDEMNDIADHCTICHKCLTPCPVDIDFGDVTILMRKILLDSNKRRSHIGTKMAMHFLNTTDTRWIRFLRFGFIQLGYTAQNTLSNWAKKLKLLPASDKTPRPTTGKASISRQIVQFTANPLPIPKTSKTLRSLLNIDGKGQVPVLSFPENIQNDDAVFYFPGCGSERLFSEVGLATIAMLAELGVRVILPPSYLCCGYPQKAQGHIDQALQINTDNRILFHRIASTMGYLDIKNVIVSCGTCMDQLLDYELDSIFPGCRQLDIHEFMLERGAKLDTSPETEYLFHEPCHDPMKQHNSLDVASTILGKPVFKTDRCCGESGTFAISRPDIAEQVRYKKQESLQAGIQAINVAHHEGQGKGTDETSPANSSKTNTPNIKILTTCPSCKQGLARYKNDTGLDADYLVVEFMLNKYGDDWQNLVLDKFAKNGLEMVML